MISLDVIISGTILNSRGFVEPHMIPWMKEEGDNTSREGGLPTLPGLNLSTFQPSQRGFFRVHVCEWGDNWRQHI